LSEPLPSQSNESAEHRCNQLAVIQQICAKWWEISKEFFNLQQLYTEEEDQKLISQAIWNSQIVLIVEVGFLAVLTLILSKEECAYDFSTLVAAISNAYKVQVKLCQIILARMIQSIVATNMYARRLSLIISESTLSPLNKENENYGLASFLQYHTTLQVKDMT